MRSGNAFYRTNEISRERPSKCSGWLEDFAEKLAVEEQVTKDESPKTAVEVARERQVQPSIFEMMSAIVSKDTPKYSSVEEAVKDYQERTGLAQYIKAQKENELECTASAVVQAGDEEFQGSEEDPDEVLSNIIEEFQDHEDHKDSEKPEGYEVCARCKHDHEYEPEEAQKMHRDCKLCREEMETGRIGEGPDHQCKEHQCDEEEMPLFASFEDLKKKV